MTFYFSPVLNEAQFDANGDPLAGGLIYAYLAGSTTPVTVYKTSTGTAHSQPIVLDSSGNYPTGTQLWLDGGKTYKFVVQTSAAVTLRTIDNITPINDSSSSADEWVQYTSTIFTYLSPTSFSVAGDQTNIFQVNRRVKTSNTGGTVYSTVTNAVYSSPNTTVTVSNDSGSLDVGLSVVYYALLSATNPSVPASFANGQRIQAQTYTAFTTGGTSTAYTGTPSPALTALTANQRLRVKFNAANTSTTPTLAVSGLSAVALKVFDATGAKVDPAVGTFVLNGEYDLEYDGTNWTVLNYPYATTTIAGVSELATGAEIATGTDTTRVMTPGNSRGNLVVSGTPQATTSGTSRDFTGLPSWVKQVILPINSLSTSGTSPIIVQAIVGGSPVTSGYLGSATACASASLASTQFTNGAGIGPSSIAATSVRSGWIAFNQLDPATNLWTYAGFLGGSDGAATSFCAGAITLAGALTGLRLTTSGGTDTFDLGNANVIYQ